MSALRVSAGLAEQAALFAPACHELLHDAEDHQEKELQQIYVDEGGKWAESTSFDDRDLPNLAKAAADVHTWIHKQKANAVTVHGTDAA
jgi:hypothetical protein